MPDHWHLLVLVSVALAFPRCSFVLLHTQKCIMGNVQMTHFVLPLHVSPLKIPSNLQTSWKCEFVFTSGCREHHPTWWEDNSGKWRSKQPTVTRVLEEIIQVEASWASSAQLWRLGCVLILCCFSDQWPFSGGLGPRSYWNTKDLNVSYCKFLN